MGHWFSTLIKKFKEFEILSTLSIGQSFQINYFKKAKSCSKQDIPLCKGPKRPSLESGWLNYYQTGTMFNWAGENKTAAAATCDDGFASRTVTDIDRICRCLDTCQDKEQKSNSRTAKKAPLRQRFEMFDLLQFKRAARATTWFTALRGRRKNSSNS